MKQHHRKEMAVPLLTGAYAIAGVFLSRALRRSSSPVTLEQILLLGGTSAAAAYVSPMITHRFMCPWSPTAPLVNAGISGALAWAALRAERFDEDSAAMFVPLQIASLVLAENVTHMMKSSKKIEGK